MDHNTRVLLWIWIQAFAILAMLTYVIMAVTGN